MHMLDRNTRVCRVAAGVAALGCWGTAHAIYGAGSLDATGFNDVGMLSGASCEVIAPNWVMTAKHVGGMTMTLDGVNYTADTRYDNPDADMSLLHFSNTFSSYYAPYFGSVVGQTLTYVGYGLSADLRTSGPYAYTGYDIDWSSAGVLRMMTNTAGRVTQEDDGYGNGWCIEADLDSGYAQSPPGSQIDYLGDGPATPNEGGLLFGDSGSPALVEIGGQWRTVGVNIDIEYTNGPDVGGWNDYCNFGDTFYSTSVGAYQNWIQTTMNPTPEPVSVSALAVGSLFFFVRKKRRR